MEEVGDNDESGIARAVSAYNYYTRHVSSSVKEELIKEGKDTALGAMVSLISARWKTLDIHEKAIFEKMAKDDRIRYNNECNARDQQILARQEEARQKNAMIETNSRMRESTMKATDETTVKFDVPKRVHTVSAKQKAIQQERKDNKDFEAQTIKEAQDANTQSRAEQAEARLQYLLRQSDIFSHFGSVKASSGKPGVQPEQTESDGKRGRGRGKASSNDDELDDDEKAMARDIGDSDDDNDNRDKVNDSKEGVVLLKQPSCVSGGPMRNYQLQGLNWMIRLMENGINGILADEMGLGKTLQSISVLGYMHEYLNISGPHLVMLPKSTLSNWMNEFKRWCPALRTVRFHGSADEREEIIRDVIKPGRPHSEKNWDVIITTYEVLNLEKAALSKISWKFLIIDEAHRLKNEASQFSQTVRLLDTQHRLLLTGTPLQNNLHELWALLNFLLPDVFASSEQFDEWFNLDVEDTEAKQRIIGQLHKILRPFMLRRLKIDVEKSLPPKTETILFTGLSVVQKALYKNILLRDIDTINSGPNSNNNGSRTAILNIVMQLRKCCNHPYLFPNTEDRTLNPMGDHLWLNCGKMVLMHKLLTKLKERGNRVLIFSQMTRMLDILEDYLISQDHLYCRIDGNTTYEEREDRIQDFNSPGSDKFIFLLSTRAGGLGINLQTADTVILYDSDWNPQADLQAQDRAHRIGQKKAVQVYRLVTDDTVECKVVERAQQKLKLDAMVVQQGRLQEKDKKMSKQDLLDTIRFGAEKIFRAKEGLITDDDIDLILEDGKKRTKELSEKMQESEKGDLYDFSLDGGMKSQVFEGKDYSTKTMRDGELAQQIAQAQGNFFIDTGKRERKAVTTYAEQITRMEDTTSKGPRIPKHMRLPKMEDWHFYDKVRLQEIQDEEMKLLDALLEKGETLPTVAISKFTVLPPHKQEEKNRLLAEAFGEWTKVHYNSFLRSSSKHGRTEYEKIAKDIGKQVDEVKRYSLTYWEQGMSIFPTAEWDRNLKQVEKGEKRLEEIQRLTSATAKLIMMFENPWEELTFRNVGNQGRIFNAIEDRFLLCMTHLHGYGNWDLVRASIRRCERFRFDFYLQSCTSDALGKRCELLMRSAERELAEIERKNQASVAISSSTSRPRSVQELSKDRVTELTTIIKEEARKIAITRQNIQKLKNGSSKGSGVIRSSMDTDGGEKKEQIHHESKGRPVLKPVPENTIPDLCQLLVANPTDGVLKIVEKFLATYKDVSKRQAELKIIELAVKEKQNDDARQMWHIKPEYQHYLTMSSGDSQMGVNGDSIDKKRKISDVVTDSSKKSMPKVQKKEVDHANKKKLASSSSSTSLSAAKKVKIDPDLPEPKKYKRAFGYFVKAKRQEAEATLEDHNMDTLKQLLINMYEKLDDNDRAVYVKKEEEDQARYRKELLAWEIATGKKASKTSSN